MNHVRLKFAQRLKLGLSRKHAILGIIAHFVPGLQPTLQVSGTTGGARRPAFVYQVDFRSPTNPDRGAFHGIDIGLVFGTFDAPDAWTGSGPQAQALSRLMQRRFVAFARTGRPDLPGAPAWPVYDERRRATMIFDIASRVENDPRRWQRELFAPAPYAQPGT